MTRRRLSYVRLLYREQYNRMELYRPGPNWEAL